MGTLIEIGGVFIIVLGAVYSFFSFGTSIMRKTPFAYDQFRRRLGRSILLGLEFLVAGDIINTVSVEPTLQNVTTLAMIVLIRTFLSFSLEIELDGRLPWKSKTESSS